MLSALFIGEDMLRHCVILLRNIVPFLSFVIHY